MLEDADNILFRKSHNNFSDLAHCGSGAGNCCTVQAPALAQGLEVLDLAVEVGGQIGAVFEVGDGVDIGVAARLDVEGLPACADHLQVGLGAACLVEDGLHIGRRHVLGRIDAKARHAPAEQSLHVGGDLILDVG